MRTSYSGNTLAFQAKARGSIPLVRYLKLIKNNMINNNKNISLKTFLTKDFSSSLLKILTILFLFDKKITWLLIVILIAQNPLIKTDILNIYSSGLFLNYKQIQKGIKILLKFLLCYYIVCSIK